MTSIKVVTEDINHCAEHNHQELERYFFDDGITSRCALELNENAWSMRLVECLCNCNYSYLQGWKFTLWGTKIDKTSMISRNTFQRSASQMLQMHTCIMVLLTNKLDNTFIISEGGDFVPTVIENSKKDLTPFEIRNVCMPQKLREVIAQVHFLASAEFLRCGINGNVPLEVETKGLLINKNTGGYHVELVAHINNPCKIIPLK